MKYHAISHVTEFVTLTNYLFFLLFLFFSIFLSSIPFEVFPNFCCFVLISLAHYLFSLSFFPFIFCVLSIFSISFHPPLLLLFPLFLPLFFFFCFSFTCLPFLSFFLLLRHYGKTLRSELNNVKKDK